MCSSQAATTEHVPPKAFFLEGYRTNLMTVPSCPAHNTSNSKDVEYVRNFIVFGEGPNEVAVQLFGSVAIKRGPGRSFRE